MRLSLSLLKKFIDIDLSPSEIADQLTLLGLEVDGIENEVPKFSGVVAAKIISAEKHPEADSLNLLKVTDGTEEFQIVCGDCETKAGMHVACAKIGATLQDEKGSFTIKRAKLRGKESFGMLCTAKELSLFEKEDHVLQLDENLPLGTDLARALHDPIFLISLTPNLGYCQSALGIAKELAAFLHIPCKIPKILEGKTSKTPFAKVETPLAPRYTCTSIRDITVQPSPFWLTQVLESSGIRSINAAVDIPNYVMLLFGQPMHAFDQDRLDGTLHIKTTDETIPFLGLDDKERTALKGSLLIYDEKKAVALAGIMGAKNSCVTNTTKNILLESGYFDPASIRKTSQKMGLRTESSMRFEKGIDPNFTPHALAFAAELFVTLCGGVKEEEYTDIKQTDFSSKKISCRLERTNQILGIKIGLEEMESIFKRIGFHTKSKEDRVEISVPYYRHDIRFEIDLIEEIARMYGYHHIEKKPASYSSSKIEHHPLYLLEKELRTKLVSMGLMEWITPDLISPLMAEMIQEHSLQKKDMISVLHSKSEDHSVLRASLLPSFLAIVKENAYKKNFDLSVFEIGRVHSMQKKIPSEQAVLSILLTGKKQPHHWENKGKNIDFYDLSGIVENLFQSMHKSIDLQEAHHPAFHPFRQANLFLDGEDIGVLGEVHPSTLTPFDIENPVYFAEIHINALLQRQKHFQMQPLPQFPSSERDWTITVRKSLPFKHIQNVLEELSSKRLERAYLLDVFTSEKLGDQKNLTLRFIYRDPFQTLSYDEVEEEHQKIQEKIRQKLG